MITLKIKALCFASVLSITAFAQTAPELPPPFATESVRKNSKVIGWPEGKTPQAPEGFKVTKFASGLNNPRWAYAASNGDIFVSQAATKGETANSILMFRDKDHDGNPETKTVFLTGLNRPFGMLILNDWFYVANQDALYKFPYKSGQSKMEAKGIKVLDLPAEIGYNNHWTRNIIANPQGTKIYITVGSGSNVGEKGMEHEVRRANILEINPDGSGERVYAAGLRNPVGMDWEPVNGMLWTAVNERDNLGDELVPDYITSVKPGGFYGWPYSYFGSNPDPRLNGERPDLVKAALVPDVALGSHTASLGLAFYNQKMFPAKYRGGAFVGQHGSWNRSEFSGYKVVFVPFKKGKPGKPEDFLTGFIADEAKSEVYGRPVSTVVLADGSLLVTDDAANTIWRVTAK